MERPPANAIAPESGTAIDASGTPWEAAKAMVLPAKWFGPDKRKISANKNRPNSAMGADTVVGTVKDCAGGNWERALRVEELAILILLKVGCAVSWIG